MSSIFVSWGSDYSLAAAGDLADLILSTAQGAADGWAKYLQGEGIIDIALAIGDVGGGNYLANGGPQYGWNGHAWEFATILEAREGYDGNGTIPDGNLTLGENIFGKFFYDPTGQSGVPADKLDAFAIFQHEIAHALGFIAFPTTIAANGTATFSGDNTTTVAGGPVTLDGSHAHLLGVEELMDPYSTPGSRPSISDLDLAMLQDRGLPIATERADKISLGERDDVFSAFGGDDQIDGSLGNDWIDGGAGNDILRGGGGRDTLNGGAGNDILTGGAGSDSITGGLGADRMSGGGGNDTFHIALGDLAMAGATDLIVDFQGAGLIGGDVIRFTGFAMGSTLELTGTSGNAVVYEVRDGAGMSEGQLMVSAGGMLGQVLTMSDYAFA